MVHLWLCCALVTVAFSLFPLIQVEMKDPYCNFVSIIVSLSYIPGNTNLSRTKILLLLEKVKSILES